MAIDIFFQNVVFSDFLLPFLLVFFIVFAILERTKVFGDDKTQINAFIAFIIGLTFVGVAFPKEVVENMILFLTVALIVMFVILILWGFVSGQPLKIESSGLKWGVGIAIVVIVILALVWAAGLEGGFLDFLFGQSWSGTFWTNIIFIAIVGAALAFVIRNTK